MYSQTRFTARYAETDQMGIIHHSNYAVWFEVGRTDFLKKAGVSNTNIEKSGVLLPLYEMSCKFKSPAKYEDEIIVKTSIKQLTGVRICFSYEVYNYENNKLLAKGETMHAWTDKQLKPINAAKKASQIYELLLNLINDQ